MELDTGSAVSVLTYKQYKEHFGHEKLAKSLATLKTCTGEKITPKGEMKCNVRFKGLEKELTLQWLVNYYNRFLPNASTVLHPLRQLLEQISEWQWTEQCEQAFTEAKTHDYI